MSNTALSGHFGFRRLYAFVAPAVVMQMFMSLYDIVDGLFVSNFVGITAFSALNLIWPLVAILGSIGYMIGAGGSALTAKLLGEGRVRDAHELFSFLVIVSLIGGLAVAAVGLLLVRPLAAGLGATGELFDLAVLYGSMLMAGIPFFLMQSAFESLFAAAGKPKAGLAFILAAGLTNFVLDALFIIVFGWGLAGAAAATIMGQMVGGALPLVYFRRSKTALLKLVRPPLQFGKLGGICLNGSSELVGVASTSIVSMLYNYQLMSYIGADGVAAYGIITYLALVFAAIYFGYTMGSAPLISYQYGAHNKTELKNLFKKSVITMLVLGVALTSLAHIIAGPIADLFVNGNVQVRELTMHGFSLFNWAFLVMGFNLFASALFTALGNGKVSALISFMRTLVFEVAAILVLPHFLGTDGIWISMVVSEAIAFAFTMFFVLYLRKDYDYL
jgi:putative MATE family efflux protein